MSKAKSSAPVKKPAPKPQSADKGGKINVTNEDGEKFSFPTALWNNLPQSKKDKFTLDTPEEIKKLSEKTE